MTFFSERKEHLLGKQQNFMMKVERLQQSEFPSAVCVDLNSHFFLFGLYYFIKFSLPLSLRWIFCLFQTEFLGCGSRPGPH